ncbi:MAG: DCC1-like thiol-disulfide oxidoreductase family protein [Candidatus Omnitrophica bacterium]|nr:DCC1-like thiol-disulfide oxidoreductase family protein [Candidatus Omnitrophota bacterium]
MNRIWHKLFLEERPSIGLSLFRIVVALTVGFYVIPTLIHPEDTYFSTAFKTYNYDFFTPGFVAWVQESPDSLVALVILTFLISWFFFFLGFFSQISCIVMTACCYYFYALNHFALGHALTWDILLVTLFLMCVTPYHGDYFSIDCVRRGVADAYKRRRPFFLQRLLQIQIGFTYFYTALYKIFPAGNWLSGNPMYYLMNYPPQGVTKNFMLKELMAAHPGFCYGLGIAIIVLELSMVFLLFNPRTRISGIYFGVLFHILLILTLDVPAIFFFLFPAQLLLFINPDRVLDWIEKKRVFYRHAPRARIIYDGQCQFCQQSVHQLQIMDLFDKLFFVDYHRYENLKVIHPQLTKEIAHSQLHLIEADGTLYGGFDVFRRICFMMPMLYPLIPIFYFPGAGVIGPHVYRWTAKNRYLFHRHKQCRDNTCFVG